MTDYFYIKGILCKRSLVCVRVADVVRSIRRKSSRAGRGFSASDFMFPSG